MERRKQRDNHHTAFNSREWSLRPQGKAIRENPSMIARQLARETHELLHAMNSPVPVPDYNTLQYVASRLPSGLEVIQGIDTYSKLVQESIRRPKAKDIDRQLGELSIEALQNQKLYIKDGMPSIRRILV